MAVKGAWPESNPLPEVHATVFVRYVQILGLDCDVPPDGLQVRDDLAQPLVDTAVVVELRPLGMSVADGRSMRTPRAFE
jgi:hypothetical protein